MARRARTQPVEGRWTAGALLFSGRPDPTWVLDDATAAHLAAALRALPALARKPRSRTRLGYRGCFVAAPDGTRWTAYAGTVVEEGMPRGAAVPAVRRDDGRAFERLVLSTAPQGALPSGLVPDDVRRSTR